MTISREPRTEAPEGTELLLRFRLEREQFALRADVVDLLLPMRPPRRIPGAPAGVLGVGVWRGRPLTVLDFPRLVGATGAGASPCLVRLAAPLHDTALYLPVAVQLQHAVLEPLEEEVDLLPFIEKHRCGEVTVRVVQPAPLVAAIAAGVEV